jgi:mRNA interferase HigB
MVTGGDALSTSFQLCESEIISRRKLRDFWTREDCKHSKQPLLSWFKENEKAEWKSPADPKKRYRSADFVGNDRIVFNIGGNKYRLVVWVKYTIKLVLIKWVGTHEEYNKISVTKVGLHLPKKVWQKKRK